MVDTISSICNIYNEDFKAYPGFQKINPKQVQTWNFEECNCASSDVFDMYFNTPRFFENLQFMEHADTILWLLSYQFNFTIVSHGNTPNLKLKNEWIIKNFKHFIGNSKMMNNAYINFIGVNFKDHADKSHVDMSGSIFVDDSYKNLLTSTASHKIVFGEVFPWNEENESATGEYKYVRCKNWIELYQEISRIQNTESHGMDITIKNWFKEDIDE